ncbi:MAG: spore coat protein [Bacilli bacterium]|nr:spore coat protein [Bacilli bacterium]
MDKVPTIISTKDLDYLNDMFQWNFSAAKLAYHFTKEVKDEEIKQELTNTYNMHKEICEGIINILG